MIFGPKHVKNYWKPQYEYMIKVSSKIYLLLLPKVCELIFSRWPRHVDRLLRTTTTVGDVGCTATAMKFSLRFDFTKAKQPNNKPKQSRSAVQRRRLDLCLYKKSVSEKKPYCTSNTNRSTTDSIKLFHKVSIRNNKSIDSETCNLMNVYSLYIAQKGHWLPHIK